MLTQDKPITLQLWEQSLEALKDPKFRPDELRLSESGHCMRKRFLSALGFEPTHPEGDDNLGVLHGGHILEAQVVEMYKRRFGGRRVVTQRVIHLPFYNATGHIDIWIPSLPLIVEVKSTSVAARDSLPRDEHLDQVQSYLHFWGMGHGCKDAELAYIFRETLEMVVFPVVYDPATGQRIEQELEELKARLDYARDAMDQGVSKETLLTWPEITPEVTNSPNGWPCSWWRNGERRYCPFFGYCHAQEEPEPPQEVPDLADLLARLKAAKERVKEAQAQVEEAKALADILEAEVHQALDRLGLNEVQADGVQFKRTFVQGRTTYAIDKAIKAGVLDEQTLARLEAYKSVGRGYWRTTIK